MKIIIAVMMTLFASGCASLSGTWTVPEEARMFQEAQASFAQGDFEHARIAFRTIASNYPKSPLAEQAAFSAVYTLVYSENPNRDYAAAAEEFAEFARQYPAGQLAGAARSWVAALQRVDESRVNQLLEEVAQLTRKIADITQDLQNARAAEERGAAERDSLIAVRQELSGRIDGLRGDNETLLAERNMLATERDALSQEKAGLQKKIAALTQEKNDLIQLKGKLEKSLHDLTMVDVRMEKRRKKIKKEEIKSQGTLSR